MLEWGGEPLTFWQDIAISWPKGAHAVIIPGGGGHEREITLSFHDSDGMPLYDWDNDIPDFMVGLVQNGLPETWYVQSRGTRIEIHPSGRFSGGFDELDVNAVVRVVAELGLTPEIRRF